MSDTIAPVSAIADVLALWGRDGWLTPPLVGIVPAQTPRLGRVRTLQLAAGSGHGMTPLFEMLSTDLSDHVLVLAGTSGVDAAVWGEILTGAALQQHAVGVLVDGAVRDRPEMLSLGLPVYARTQAVVGPNGAVHVVGTDCSVTIASTVIDCDDRVVIDATGCVHIREADLTEVLDAAGAYAAAEARVVEAISAGVALAEAYQIKKTAVAALRQ